MQKQCIITLHSSYGCNYLTNTMYCISRPIRRTFFLEKCDLIRPASYAPRVSIIFILINTCTSIKQHLSREIVKFASKS